MRPGSAAGSRQQGFTYFAVIIAILVIGIALAVVGVVTRTEVQRQREVQLLWVGHQIRHAISHYYRMNAGHFPQTLQELVQDDQAVKPVHHLRKLYLDPMTGDSEWQFLRAVDGGIYGVYSASTAKPRKNFNFDPEDVGFEDATCYRAWRFAFTPRSRVVPLVPLETGCPDK
jgi:type II secretory pathway pseudopilin PulG